jgi:lysozyme family protein
VITALIADLIRTREGGFSNAAADRGGSTRWGITEAVARSHGYSGAMADLPIGVASTIYLQDYWITPHLDLIDQLAPTVAAKLFDIGVNMGPVTAGKFLQRCLNVLNLEGQSWPDLKPDGQIGPRSLDALRQFISLRGTEGEGVLRSMIAALQAERYIAIAEATPGQEAFEYGWQRLRALY